MLTRICTQPYTQGQFAGGELNGQGVYTFNDGSTYAGFLACFEMLQECVDTVIIYRMLIGRGMKQKDNDPTVQTPGEFKDGWMHGKGTYWHGDGSKCVFVRGCER